MQVHVLWNGWKPTEAQRTLWRRQMGQLRRSLRGLDVSGSRLHAALTFSPKRKRYEVSLRMSFPQYVAIAQEGGHDFAGVLGAAFDELKRQIGRYRELRRKASALRRMRRIPRQELALEEKLWEQLPRTVSAQVQELVRELQGRLGRWVRRELVLQAAARGLELSGVDPQDVLQNGFLHALTALEQKPSDMSLRAWLVRHVWEALEATLQELAERQRQEEVHLETDVPEVDPVLAATAAADERYAFAHPDEDWVVADLLPDPQPADPQARAELRDLVETVVRALARLPERWRRIFTLHRVHGLSEEEIANAMGLSAHEVHTTLERAEAFLRHVFEEPAFRKIHNKLPAQDVPEELRVWFQFV